MASRFIFIQLDDNGNSVEMKVNGDTTWMELTDNFVRFLSASGYLVSGEEVGCYLTENMTYESEYDGVYPTNYDDNEITLSDINWSDDSQVIVLDSEFDSQHDTEELDNVMKSWASHTEGKNNK